MPQVSDERWRELMPYISIAVAREQADVLNHLWDWSTTRLQLCKSYPHPWYAALGLEMRAVVRGYSS